MDIRSLKTLGPGLIFVSKTWKYSTRVIVFNTVKRTSLTRSGKACNRIKIYYMKRTSLLDQKINYEQKN
jgi:hypothetical protein